MQTYKSSTGLFRLTTAMLVEYEDDERQALREKLVLKMGYQDEQDEDETSWLMHEMMDARSAAWSALETKRALRQRRLDACA